MSFVGGVSTIKEFKVEKLLTGDRFICLKTDKNDNEEFVLYFIDLHNELDLEEKASQKAEAVLKHPSKNILVCKAFTDRDESSQFIQIFNYIKRVHLGEYTFKTLIDYWDWIDDKNIVIVAEKTVFIWLIEDSDEDKMSNPIELFNLDHQVCTAKILNLSIDDTQDMDYAAITLLDISTNNPTLWVQLHSIKKSSSQLIKAQSACFGKFVYNNVDKSFISIIRKNEENLDCLYIIDCEGSNYNNEKTLHICAKLYDNTVENEVFENNIVVYHYFSTMYGLIYVVYQGGQVAIHNVYTGEKLSHIQIEESTVAKAKYDAVTGGVIIIYKTGNVYKVYTDNNNLMSTLHKKLDTELYMKFTNQFGYPCSDNYNTKRFYELIEKKLYHDAAKLCMYSKSGCLRNESTIKFWRQLDDIGATEKPILLYYKTALLMPGQLTTDETVDLVKPLINHNKLYLAGEWINSNKLKPSEELGDLLYVSSTKLALKIYRRAKIHTNVIMEYVSQNNYTELNKYRKQIKLDINYLKLITEYIDQNSNYLESFTKSVLLMKPLEVEPYDVLLVFIEKNKLNIATSVFTEVLSQTTLPNQANIETKLLEQNLADDVHGAIYLLEQKVLKQFDKKKIAVICENKKLYDKALELYNELDDIKRVLIKCGDQLNNETIETIILKFDVDDFMKLVNDIYTINSSLLVALFNACVKENQVEHVKLLLSFIQKLPDPKIVYNCLKNVIDKIEDTDLHTRYVELTINEMDWEECERIINTSAYYDQDKIKAIFNSGIAIDPKCIIEFHIKFDHIEELTEYLWRINDMELFNNFMKNLEKEQTHRILATLLDIGEMNITVLEILNSLGNNCVVSEVISVFEERKKLEVLYEWLMDQYNKNCKDVELHNALAKIQIDQGTGKEFLSENHLYDFQLIGNYAETKDNELALIAYEHGNCHDEVIRLCYANNLFAFLADFGMSRQDENLWRQIFSTNFELDQRRSLIEEIKNNCLSSCNDAKQIVALLNVLKVLNEPVLLLPILEALLIQDCLKNRIKKQFKEDISLNNLLINTVILMDSSLAIEYIKTVTKISPGECARYAITHQKYEEAIAIYEQANMNSEVINIIIEHLQDYERAEEFADLLDQPDMYHKIGYSACNYALVESINNKGVASSTFSLCVRCFIKAKKCNCLTEMVELGKKLNKYDELKALLSVLRDTQSNSSNVDTELAYCIGKTEDIVSLKVFLNTSKFVNCVKLSNLFYEDAKKLSKNNSTNSTKKLGLATFNDFLDIDITDTMLGDGINNDDYESNVKKNYEIAKVFFEMCGQYDKVTECNINTNNIQDAIESAKKCTTIQPWLQLFNYGKETKDWKTSDIATKYIINYSLELPYIIEEYEKNNKIQNLISIFENESVNSKIGAKIASELAVIYAKYEPDKLLNYLKKTFSMDKVKLNIKKVIDTCMENQLWQATVYLHNINKEYDKAINLIIVHPELDWNYDEIVKLSKNAVNKELVYQTINYFLTYYPEELVKYLTEVSDIISYERLINLLKGHEYNDNSPSTYLSPIGLCFNFFKNEQKKANNVTCLVNDCINEIYYEIKDFASLNNSITNYNNFTHNALASKLEQDNTLYSKNLALLVYLDNKNYAYAIKVAKKLKLYSEAIAIAYQSTDITLIEELMFYFANELNDVVYFAVCIIICEAYIKFATVLKYIWLHDYYSTLMPYIIIQLQKFDDKVNNLQLICSNYVEHNYIKNTAKQSTNNLKGDLNTINRLKMLSSVTKKM